jgi:hypothetical protein
LATLATDAPPDGFRRPVLAIFFFELVELFGELLVKGDPGGEGFVAAAKAVQGIRRMMDERLFGGFGDGLGHGGSLLPLDITERAVDSVDQTWKQLPCLSFHCDWAAGNKALLPLSLRAILSAWTPAIVMRPLAKRRPKATPGVSI